VTATMVNAMGLMKLILVPAHLAHPGISMTIQMLLNVNLVRKAITQSKLILLDYNNYRNLFTVNLVLMYVKSAHLVIMLIKLE
jgi:hypothetical protein